MEKHINVYGAGLAGCEAAWQAASRGVAVTLYEMKPKKFTPAHHSEGYAELVCSNSLRSDRITVASGLLKEELSRMGSLIMEAARATQVPAGSALAVDRDKFSAYVTEKIQNHPLITVVEAEITAVSENACTVTPVQHADFSMGVRIDNNLAIGVISGTVEQDGEVLGVLRYISYTPGTQSELAIGMRVLTETGGLVVGDIVSVGKDAYDGTIYAYIRYAADSAQGALWLIPIDRGEVTP